MQVQVNTGHNVEGSEDLVGRISGIVENALRHMSEHVTRVEVHLSDENGFKGGPSDKRCVMEARLEGRQPIAVTEEAPNLDQSAMGAADKLARLIEHTLGRAEDSERRHRQRPPV